MTPSHARFLLPAAFALLLMGCDRDDRVDTQTRGMPATTTESARDMGDMDRRDDNRMGQSRGAAATPALTQLAEAGGAAEAAVEYCDLDDDSAAAKRRQREQFTQMGGTSEQFETAYRAGLERAQAEYRAAGAADRDRICENFRQSHDRMR